MAIGPVQLLVVGFEGGDFEGEILAELDRLRENDIVRLIDLAFVRKDADGRVERVQRSDLSPEEAEQFGAIVGALIGFGAAGEEGAELGAIEGAAALEDGHVSTRKSGTSTMRSRTAPRRPWPCWSTAGRSRCAKAFATRAASTSPMPGSTRPTSWPSALSPPTRQRRN